ncbi:enoyl-CoA hydratase/isomerase family protein [Geotalea toluenoxydans]|uniref:enoyl-CoA hydratase/isomerase family protein n=1 Tax=Geotalea toluenoxydans TaxID=421624 RepID=UPI000AA12F2B
MSYEFITLKKDDRVLTISLNRPPTNPLNGRFGQELFKAFSEAEQLDEVTVVVITSALEKAFIAGADIKEMAAQDAAEAEQFSKLLQGANNILNRMKKIVIAAINGHALGGGCELALACDYRLMTSGKVDRSPRSWPRHHSRSGWHTTAATAGGAIQGSGYSFPRQDHEPPGGPGDRPGGQAHRAGEFPGRGDAVCPGIGCRGGQGLGLHQAAVYEGIDLPLEQALAVERKYSAENSKTHDAKEGLTAFVEKRKPDFLNK